MGSEKNCVRQMQRTSYCKVTLVISLKQKTLTQEQTAKKKMPEQKVKAQEKKGTGVMEDKAKKILENFVFAKQLLWHLHGP